MAKNWLAWWTRTFVIFYWSTLIQGKYPNSNFTSGLVGWTNIKKLQWKAANYSLNTTNGTLTGRQGNGDGFALIDFDNSTYYARGKTAEMYSSPINGSICMKFFFHFHGSETGILKILTRPVGYTIKKTVFHRYGNHNQKWQLGQVFLESYGTNAYQVIISGEVGNISLRGSPAIDDISFFNGTCEKIPQDKGYNCSFRNGFCGWTVTRSRGSTVSFDQGINSYCCQLRGTYYFSRVYLESPSILAYSGCFSFQFRVEWIPRYWPLWMRSSTLSVSVVDKSQRIIPVWNGHLHYHENDGDWRTVEFGLNFTKEFTKIVFAGYRIYGGLYFTNVIFRPTNGKCKNLTVEKTFFTSISLTLPTRYIISDNGVPSDSYPVSYFNARVFPSSMYSKPIYLYSWDEYMWLTDRRQDYSDEDLVGYFYASTAYRANTTAVNYELRGSYYSTQIAKLEFSQATEKTNKSFFIPKFEEFQVSTKCPPSWEELSGKCFKIFRALITSGGVGAPECFKEDAELASLDTTTLPIILEYFERIKLLMTGYTAVSIGLFKVRSQWTWSDGRTYNKSLGFNNSKSSLTWDKVHSRWDIQGSNKDNYLYLCEKIRVNAAFHSQTNQSSTNHSSNLAVDGLLGTCSLLLQKPIPSWWRVRLPHVIKIYIIKLFWSWQRADTSLQVTAGLLNLGAVLCRMSVTSKNKGTQVICEPPKDGDYVMLQTEAQTTLQICEIEVYGIESSWLRQLSGVSRAIWRGIRGDYLTTLKKDRDYPSYPDMFHVISTFDPPKNVENNYGQLLVAYFMPEVSGNYTFFLTGDDDVEFYISDSREGNSVRLISIIGQKMRPKAYQWDRYPSNQTSPVQYLYACQFFFLKVLMKEGKGQDHVSLGIQHPNGSYEKPMSGKNLFWVLPGKLRVEFNPSQSTAKQITIGHPLNITGSYSSTCVGLYCGSCPLAIFLTFAGHFQCVLLTNQTISYNGTLSLVLNDWFAFAKAHPILMGFQRNGNCSMIENTAGENFESNINVTVVASLDVKPIILASCQFKRPHLCNNTGTFSVHGWSQVPTTTSVTSHGITIMENTTATFSYKWIKFDKIVQKTGVCVRFSYMMSGDNNTLSLLVETSSGKRWIIWALRGHHGDKWKIASAATMPNESFMFVFEGNSSYPNTTVAIAAVNVTTESCPYQPDFAKPGHQCPSGKFRCDNGECIESKFVCNGDYDCTDGSDEKKCPCISTEFRCSRSGKCIPVTQLCDDKEDCSDGSDEENCKFGCKSEELYCPSGKCVPWSSTCDNKRDCLDGADEPDVCDILIKEKNKNRTCSLNSTGCFIDCDASQGDCDFEYGICSYWKQGKKSEDDFDWLIKTGRTSSHETGPDFDHTLKTAEGKYIFIEASQPRRPGDRAELLGSPVQGGKNVCFTFYYHMFGSGIGHLNFYKNSSNKTNKELLWTKSGSQGDMWRKGWFDIGSKNRYQIIIEAVRGDSEFGDIAIDDISIFEKNCSEVENDVSSTCSFQTCNWTMNTKIWKPCDFNDDSNLLISNKKGSCISTSQTSHVNTSVQKPMTSRFKCIWFWYKYSACTGMEFNATQTMGKSVEQHSFPISHENNKWWFAEMPLVQSLEEYTVSFKVTIPDKSSKKCYLSINNVNFSLEPCLNAQAAKSKGNSVLCPENWLEFQGSCYKFVLTGTPWWLASIICQIQTGASLVELNNNVEEQFVTTTMKHRKSQRFWIAPSENQKAKYKWLYSNITLLTINSTCPAFIDEGVVSRNCLERYNYVCEYKLAAGSCDFETNWCNWTVEEPDETNSTWNREFQNTSHAAWSSGKDTESAVDIYVSINDECGSASLTVDDENIQKFTLCLWLYPYINNTDAIVLTYGDDANHGLNNGLKICFHNNSNYTVAMNGWNTTTNATVSFETWQHICFSIDTTTSVWSFYKDGSLTNMGISSITQGVQSSTLYLGPQCFCHNGQTCSYLFFGKMTKPTIWSKILNSNEVSIVSTGCGLQPSIPGKVEVRNDGWITDNEIRVGDGECVQGKGYRLTSTTDSTSSLVSPWLKGSLGGNSGVCLVFAYRLLGEGSGISVSVKRGNMKEEILWHAKNSRSPYSSLWRYGQVFLGLLTEFKVIISATHGVMKSKISIDNIFFKSGWCISIPTEALGQDLDTTVLYSSSGFLTSPYYPLSYHNNMRRTWIIKVPVGQRIELSFEFLNLEDDPQCSMDFVSVSDGKSLRKLSRYCGHILPSHLISRTNTLWVNFESNKESVGTGFKIHYKAIDGRCSSASVLSCPHNVRCYRLASIKPKVFVSAKSLFYMPSIFPEGATVIQFDGNSLVKLNNQDLRNLTDLQYMSLRKNKITGIEEEAFRHLGSLKTLLLSGNFVKNIPKDLFLNTRSLDVLDLGWNRITELDGLFRSEKNLSVLSVRHNPLKTLPNNVFSGLGKLQYLYLDSSLLSQIDPDAFKGLRQLKVLTLNDNKLEILKASWFDGMSQLKSLNLRKNGLKQIEPGSFKDLENLVELDLSKNHLTNLPDGLFDPLTSLKSLKVDHFTLCCYAKQAKSSVSCESPAHNGFSSCDELLKNTALKYSIWVLGVMAFAGNLIVVLWRIVAKDRNVVNSFLLTNLAVADFMMGVYLLVIAYKNTIWQGVYFKHDISWRASDLCFFTGVVSTISSEVSVFTLCVITLDRLICCVFPFRFRRISMKKASVIMLFVWVAGTVIALAPLFDENYFEANFYGRSAVCLPLQLSSDRPAGWEYSVFVFIGLNGFSFLFILVSYCVLYWTVSKAAAAARSTRTNQNAALARRMLLIILTDFFCWFPVIIMSILSLTGHLYDPNNDVYAWIAVFVLPINSSINPILYTFSTSFVRINLVNAVTSRISSDSRGISRRIDTGGFLSAGVSNTYSTGNNTVIPKPPVTLPESKLEVINEAFMSDEKIAESASMEPPLDHKHCIRLLEDLEMDGSEEKLKKTLIAHQEVDNNEILCLVHVYNHDHRKLWENTTEILGRLSLDGGHKKIVHYLWSADASKVSVEKQEMIATSDIKLENNDCFICYELPSKSTLQDVIDNSCSQLTSEVVHVIAKDLIQAISYLSSKQIVHNAIFPRNIFVIRSPQSSDVSAILGGFYAARSVSSMVGDDENQQKTSELANDIEAYGNILKLLYGACPSSEELSLLQEMTASCLTEDPGKRPSALDLRRQIESQGFGLAAVDC